MIKSLLRILFVFTLGSALSGARPNVVLVITDDQGYGDLGCTGNPVIKTPHTDKLANESVWLSDYHVAPTCSPTRAALISGHWTNRTGVWHTIMGRSMLRANEGTIGQMLQDNGYETGMFGKWHMGGQRDVDDAPPISDYGFDRSLTNFEGMGPKLLPLTLKPGQNATATLKKLFDIRTKPGAAPLNETTSRLYVKVDDLIRGGSPVSPAPTLSPAPTAAPGRLF